MTLICKKEFDRLFASNLGHLRILDSKYEVEVQAEAVHCTNLIVHCANWDCELVPGGRKDQFAGSLGFCVVGPNT